MRSTWHYVKIVLLFGIAVAAYATVFCFGLRYWASLTPPVAVSLIGAGIAVVTSLIALTKDPILEIINSPKLKIGFFPYDKRDCHTTTIVFYEQQTGGISVRTHYFRMRIENIGWRTAEEVEVTLEEVKRFTGDKFTIDTDFMPLRLLWSHWRQNRFELPIPPGVYRHFDLGFVLDPAAKSPLPPTENDKVLFWFDVFPRPNTGRTSLLPGKYQVYLRAFGKNVRCASLKMEFEWAGVWRDDIDALYRDGPTLTRVIEAANC